MITTYPSFDWYSPSVLGFLVVDLPALMPLYVIMFLGLPYIAGLAQGGKTVIKKPCTRLSALSWCVIATIIIYIWTEVAT